MKIIQLLLAVGLVAICLSQAALGKTEVKPFAEINTKSFEGSITIEVGLKAYPKLYATLVAAGKRDLAKWAADAERERKANPSEFGPDRRWSLGRGYILRSIVGRYVSIVRVDDTYGGGAHPNHRINTLLWDARANKFINVSPFLDETGENGPTLRALAKAIRAAVALEKKSHGIAVADPDTDPELASVEPKLATIGGIALAPSTEKGKACGFSVYFSPYAVGSYVEGPYTVFIPWRAFKAHLSPLGAALFGGERPKDDEKNE
ncbi:MAG: hypothetical protein ACREB2_01035 [Pseudolabrys sp.]